MLRDKSEFHKEDDLEISYIRYMQFVLFLKMKHFLGVKDFIISNKSSFVTIL